MIALTFADVRVPDCTSSHSSPPFVCVYLLPPRPHHHPDPAHPQGHQRRPTRPHTMSAPYSNLPAPRFAPPKPSPLSQNTSFLSSDPPTAGPSNSTDTNHPTGGGGGAGGGGSSKKKRHYHHHHGRKESQSAGGGGDKGDSSAQPQGSNKRKRDGGGGGGGPANGEAHPAKHKSRRRKKGLNRGRASAGGLTSTTTVSGDATPAKQFATQIVKLVDALKVRVLSPHHLPLHEADFRLANVAQQNNGPMNLSDLEGITGVRGLLSEHTDVPFNQELYDAFNAHDRVILSDKGKVKLWSYRVRPLDRSSALLTALIR